MLTPVEIQSKTFRSGGLGYDKKDVDHFMIEVLDSFSTIYRENMELNDKISTLSEGIQYYKSIEKTLQKALVLAENTAAETIEAAKKQAKSIEKEAATRAQVIMADAKNELEHVHAQTIKIVQEYEKYKAQFRALADAQMKLLESESFDINIANLEAFIPVNMAKDLKYYYNNENVNGNDSNTGSTDNLDEEMILEEEFDNKDTDISFVNIDEE